MDRLLPSDIDRISDAVAAAEATTSGEIVPYIVTESDEYGEAIWRAAAIGSTLTLLILSAATYLFGRGVRLHVVGIALLTVVAGLFVATVVAAVPALKRFASGQALIIRRTAQRAAEAFLSEELFATRERTGILLFVSLLEHRVIVLGDSGINDRVRPEEWKDVVDIVTAGIRRGAVADGIIAGIERCAALLVDRGFTAAEDDVDELANRIRIAPQSAAPLPTPRGSDGVEEA